MTTLVVGAHGKIGQRLCERAVSEGLSVRALVRNEEQQNELARTGVETVIGDLEGDLAHAFEGCDEVVFTAGSGPHTGADKTLMIDLNGAWRCVEYAEALNMKRFIMVSTLHREPLDGPDALVPYLAAKRAADYRVTASTVPHVLVRPGRLTDDRGTGHYSIAVTEENGGRTSRDNVAEAIVHLLGTPVTDALDLPLLDGDTPWSELEKSLSHG
ncbi:SDR family oxidoreductase [Larsenimonas rhizosphaerae]|uniref:SDR family oxidoreductase n=1 Tax=Larsenimonas rhizosphaerae TaxID=2944682 RepID=A0AA41ZGQ1_9GAMM|nr:SDR family oxidoreductase [Larsenimonas rhizosphaerae]MCM2130874.1 SDR family oxidoreductase [Larsenimonas rhizosphaerae]MCX2523578.1 SDR family oxidoreductase [Larsenimonas rhizosphaerae]